MRWTRCCRSSSDEPVPPRRLNASVPRDLETICLKCLEKESGKRYVSAAALGEDLRRYLDGEPIVARPVTRFVRAAKWARRKPAVAALLGLVALVTALGLGGVLWQWREAVDARDVAERETERAKSQTELAEERLEDAVKARAEEKKQTELASQRLRNAVEAQAKERKQTELAEQRLYDVRMNFVQRHWTDYDGKLFQQGLVDQLPANQSGIDRRGFEWFYWQRKLSSGHITLKEHIDGNGSIAFSPDGKRFASGVFDQTVKVWDIGTGRQALNLTGHIGIVSSVAFSADGKRLSSAGSDKTVKIWDAATGRNTLTLKGHTDFVNNVAFSPDGKRLASASQDRTVKLWDTATGQELLTLGRTRRFGHERGLQPHGKWLASADSVGTVKVWDAASGRETHTYKGHTRPVGNVAFSPDGMRLASASFDQTVKVWDVGDRARNRSPSWGIPVRS